MSAREPIDRHSDLGPSSKDWQTGSPGRDEDFTPDKDHWTIDRKGSIGEGRPGEDIHAAGTSGAADSGQNRSGSARQGGDVQPGTQSEGRSWQSRRPDPANPDDKLQQALKDSFPASDPPQAAQPGITGWDVGDSEHNRGPVPNAPGPRRPDAPSSGLTGRTAGVPWGLAALAAVPVLFAAGRMLTRSRRFRRR